MGKTRQLNRENRGKFIQSGNNDQYYVIVGCIHDLQLGSYMGTGVGVGGGPPLRRRKFWLTRHPKKQGEGATGGVIFGRRRQPKIFLSPLGEQIFYQITPQVKKFWPIFTNELPPRVKKFSTTPLPRRRPQGGNFSAEKFLPPTPLRGVNPHPASMTLPMYDQHSNKLLLLDAL